MENYKAGQVSALLFPSKSRNQQTSDDALTALFTAKKKEKTGKNVSKRKSVAGSLDALITNENNKLSKEALKEKGKNRKKKLKRGKLEESSKENTQLLQRKNTEMPYLHETLVNKPSTKSSTPKKTPKAVNLKRKLEEEDKEEEERETKRLRRNRKRDKRADQRTVFIGNCPLTATKKTLKSLFKEFGDIENIRTRCVPAADPNLPRRATVITKNYHEQGKNCVAYVVFTDEDSAKKSLIRNGHLLDGLHLRVDIAANSHKHDKKRSIFVGNLPFTITEEVIRSHFSDCGTINNVRIVRDRQTSLGKGICYVQFELKDSVNLALKMDSWEIQGRKARVKPCASKTKQEEVKAKENKRAIKQSNDSEPKKKKISFGPSNAKSSTFMKKLQEKKEKRMKKKKKLKNSTKKGDGLSAIFGDAPSVAPLKKNKQKNNGVAKGKNFGRGPVGGKGKPKKGLQKGSQFKGSKGGGFRGKHKRKQ